MNGEKIKVNGRKMIANSHMKNCNNILNILIFLYNIVIGGRGEFALCTVIRTYGINCLGCVHI